MIDRNFDFDIKKQQRITPPPPVGLSLHVKNISVLQLFVSFFLICIRSPSVVN